MNQTLIFLVFLAMSVIFSLVLFDAIYSDSLNRHTECKILGYDRFVESGYTGSYCVNETEALPVLYLYTERKMVVKK